MLRAWSDDVTLLTEHPLELRDDEIVLADGSTRPCGGLMMVVRLHQRDDLACANLHVDQSERRVRPEPPNEPSALEQHARLAGCLRRRGPISLPGSGRPHACRILVLRTEH